MNPDHELVASQLGREPRIPWRVVVRCDHGAPSVIAMPPRLSDGAPFPTLYWLTCPFLVAAVHRLESEGGAASSAEQLAANEGLAARMIGADAEYRRRRAQEAEPSTDPCASVGIAGQADPLKTKCLHAHVAAALAVINDPVGVACLDIVGRSCPQGRCPSDGVE